MGESEAADVTFPRAGVVGETRDASMIAVSGEPLRYRDVGLIARGGMSEVRRVWDSKLQRPLAMKILEWDALDDAAARSLFVAEASVTAGLQHPGIVAVHDWGELEDGRLWFTMREVRGRTLQHAIYTLHAAQTGTSWCVAEDGTSLYGMIEAFRRVCEATAYAHRHGVVHRDLKPANIMLGDFAEVLVMDWGVARRLDASIDADGDVFGTPAFMSPEQARGEPVTPATDVYALGAVLRCILLGVPPYVGRATEVIAAVAAEPPPPMAASRSPGTPPIPDRLVAICERAMDRGSEQRFPEAGALATEIASYLEGTRRREHAQRLVAEADELEPEISATLSKAEEMRERAASQLRALPPLSSSRDKAPGWRLEDYAAEVERGSHMKEARWLQLLRQAVEVDGTLGDPHDRLARHYHARVVAAERAGRPDEASRNEAFLRVHDRGTYGGFLTGEGAVWLRTDPAGAEVTAFQWVERDRRLVLERHGHLGTTPLEGVRLPHGSWLLVLRAAGYLRTHYPILLERAGQWDCVPPGETEARPVRLLTRKQVPRGFVHVPAGWFWGGGDPEATDCLPRRRIWIDDFVIGRHPVTNAEWLEYVNALVAHGREDEALRAAPRAPLGIGADDDARVVVARGADGRFALSVDDVGQRWEPDAPVSLVDWHAARAYAAWRGKMSGSPLRLPNELEWEKAGRGPDGRFWPWGRVIDPTFCNVLGGAATASPCSVRRFPADRSPYGVRHMAGNVREWCINAWRPDGPSVMEDRLQLDAADDHDDGWRAARGGAWHTMPVNSRLAGRFVAEPYRRFSSLGLRLSGEVA